MAKLKIEYVPITELKLNPRNPRVHPTSQVLALKGSLEEYDWTGPVLAQKGTKVVIKGLGTIKAARLRGDKTVPVIFHDWTDAKVKAYMIADNKLGELSYWDERELSRLLSELGENTDLKDLGFNKDELEKLIPELAAEIKSYEEELEEEIAKVETTGLVSPIYWVGGKNRIANWIISHFPPHVCYAEPFGGAAAVLLHKPLAKSEVYNDINKFVCEFFQCLRDNPRELLSNLAFMPHSRELYNILRAEFKNGDVHPDNMVLRSACWYYVQHNSFSGQWGADWAHRKTKAPARMMGRLLEVAIRLKNVYIENKDFRYIFKTYDSEETLFYVDPPYLEREYYYKAQAEKFTLEDHKDLAEILQNIRGKACVSYYPHPFIDKAYKGWRRVAKQVVAWSYGVTGVGSRTGKRPKRVELLLMNY